jgi:signal transduction histidine kinase
LRRRQKDVQQELKKPGLSQDKERLRELLGELERISHALRDPNLDWDGTSVAARVKSA